MAQNSQQSKPLADTTSLSGFYQRLCTAGQRILLLDYDGTLAPFRLKRNEALPFSGVREILDAIMENNHTRVIIVSGRWIQDLKPVLGLKRLPEIWGSHGWERLQPNGEYFIAKINEDSLQQLVEADSWIPDLESLGARCERKPASLAIHWRGLSPERIETLRDRVLHEWQAQKMQNHLAWHDFDGGIELRAPGRHKGSVVEAVLSQAEPDAVAAYLGDDLTDEDAFKAIRGRGIGILVRPQFRATAADFWLQPPAELLKFLRKWHEKSCAQHGSV